MEERIQKILSRCGVASRRKAEQMILDRRVRVNGNTAMLGDTADETQDVIEVDGVKIKPQTQTVCLMLNKPRGYVTTMHDEKGRKSVDLLVADCPQRVYPVGRLDMYSEGLLLLTNDGELANRLMHPRQEIQKTYLVRADGWHDGCEAALSSPIEIDGRMTAPADVHLIRTENGQALLEMTLHEGRNRQIRRLCEAAGLRVLRLRRIAEGPLQLGRLPAGSWRMLTEQELESLRNF